MAQVAIEMLATLSGEGESWGPGSVLMVEAAEAERLIGLGAAKASEKPVVTGSPAKVIIDAEPPKRGRKPKGD